MKYSIVYSSKTGNTKQVAEEILNFYGYDKCAYFGNPSYEALQANVIFVGFWTDKSRPNSECIEFLKQIDNKKIFIFGTAGFGKSDQYFKKILKKSIKCIKNSNEILGTFMCQGKMPDVVRERYVRMAEKPIHIPNIQKMIENFDEAKTHPDELDLQRLKECLEKIVILF